MEVDYTDLRQRFLNDINRIREEGQTDRKISGEDKRLAEHILLMKDVVTIIKETNSKEASNLRRYVTVTFKKLLQEMKIQFNNKNNKLLDHIWNEYGVALWKDKNFPKVVYMRVEGVNIIF